MTICVDARLDGKVLRVETPHETTVPWNTPLNDCFEKSPDLTVLRRPLLLCLQELVSRYEKETEQHQGYQDACAAFTAWLRTTREQFTTCCDIYGDKVTITAKLDRTKVHWPLDGDVTAT